MKRLIIIAFLLSGCGQWPSSETMTEILETVGTFAKCAEIAHQCTEKLKPAKDVDEALPILIDCKDQLLANDCKESIENLF